MTLSIKAEGGLPGLLILACAVACAQQPASPNAGGAAALTEQRQSLFTQRASITRQMGSEKFAAYLGSTFYGTIRPVNPVPALFNCPPLDTDKREDLIFQAARVQAIEPALVRAVMHRESAFHPCAVSDKGALGLMQLMPATLAQFHVTDPFDPAQSAYAGAALLKTLLDKYQGDLKLTLAAYNAGPMRIDNADPAAYPSETKSYVAEILAELGVKPNSPLKPIE